MLLETNLLPEKLLTKILNRQFVQATFWWAAVQEVERQKYFECSLGWPMHHLFA